MNAIQKLREMGYDTVPEDFYDYVKLWRSWYAGNVKNFHNYRVFNGQRKVKCTRYTLGMANKVSADWADLLMNEKVHITLEGDKEQEFFDKTCRENNFFVKANEMQELKAALGTTAYVPTVYSLSVNAETGDVYGTDSGIKIEYVTAENIIPLSWDASGVKECAFAAEKVTGKNKYIYMQIHKINGQGMYDIENRMFETTNGRFSEVPLSDVRGFEAVVPVVHTNSARRQFVIDRLNIANNVDVSLPMGVSVFSNAIDNLKGVDVAYDSYVNEFILGKKRVIVQPESMKDYETGEPYFDVNDLTFYTIPGGGQDVPVKEIDMKLRTTEHNVGIQDMLNALSSKCGFGKNHYKFNSGNISTATQVVSENSSMFRTIKKHEIVLESVLVELARIILRMGNMYMNAGLNEEVEISVDFDDSIIEDKDTEFNRDSRMLQMGIMNAWEFRSKYMNEDPETAKEALPKLDALVNEGI